MTEKDKKLAEKIFGTEQEQYELPEFSFVEEQQIQMWAELFESFPPPVLETVLKTDDNFIAPPTNISFLLN